MDNSKLNYLLDLDESSTLEFKRDMYAIYSEKEKVPNQQRGELIKDILALANGNFDSVGEEAYLIVGVENMKDIRGKRKIIGVEGKLPSVDDILNMIRNVSNPPLQNLETEILRIEGKYLWVITIPASPNVYETKKVLETPTTNHYAHMVFIRRNSCIDNASTKERTSLEMLKKIHLEEQMKIPTAIATALGGTLLLGPFMAKNIKKLTDGKISNRVGLFTGIIIGAITGGSIGYSLNGFNTLIYEIRKLLFKRHK